MKQKLVESSATLTLEDLKTSHSYDYDPTTLIKIEDALQAESYECKEEFHKEDIISVSMQKEKL